MKKNEACGTINLELINDLPLDWKSDEAFDRVRGLIYHDFGRLYEDQSKTTLITNHKVKPLTISHQVARYRIDFYNRDNTLNSSFYMVANILEHSIEKVEISRNK